MSKVKLSSLTKSQREVYSILKTYGPLPDHALVPLAQHVSRSHQSSSGIRSRRAELVAAGCVKADKQSVVMPSGRKAQFFKAV